MFDTHLPDQVDLLLRVLSIRFASLSVILLRFSTHRGCCDLSRCRRLPDYHLLRSLLFTQVSAGNYLVACSSSMPVSFQNAPLACLHLDKENKFFSTLAVASPIIVLL